MFEKENVENNCKIYQDMWGLHIICIIQKVVLSQLQLVEQKLKYLLFSYK